MVKERKKTYKTIITKNEIERSLIELFTRQEQLFDHGVKIEFKPIAKVTQQKTEAYLYIGKKYSKKKQNDY